MTDKNKQYRMRRDLPQGSWSYERQITLSYLRSLTPSDRLSHYVALVRLIQGLKESVQGWEQWLKNPLIFDKNFSERELKEMFDTVYPVVAEFIDYDIKVTAPFDRKKYQKEKQQKRQPALTLTT